VVVGQKLSPAAPTFNMSAPAPSDLHREIRPWIFGFSVL
jgi:hypothetical protein